MNNRVAGRTLSAQRGFTIVELLIVIVVIAILAAISIVAYVGIQKQANVSVTKSDLAAIERKLQAFYAENERFPDDLDEMKTYPFPATSKMTMAEERWRSIEEGES